MGAINRIKWEYALVKAFINDYCWNRQTNMMNHHKNNVLGRIMLLMHALEKGMSFPGRRTFGGDKALLMSKALDKYIYQYGINDVCIYTINVLNEYLQRENSTTDLKIRNEIKVYIKKYEQHLQSDLAGIQEVIKPPLFNTEMIMEFYSSRHSVREYSNLPITDSDIEAASQLAALTPTACNRQGCRVHVYRDKEIMDKLIDNQLGNQGWCQNATCLFVICVDNAFFNGGYERQQALVDGGMYAMNFVMGLHLRHIATCFKMYVRLSRTKEEEFKEIANIPKSEIPIVCILAGHYKSKAVLSPKSARFDCCTPIYGDNVRIK